MVRFPAFCFYRVPSHISQKLVLKVVLALAGQSMGFWEASIGRTCDEHIYVGEYIHSKPLGHVGEVGSCSNTAGQNLHPGMVVKRMSAPCFLSGCSFFCAVAGEQKVGLWRCREWRHGITRCDCPSHTVCCQRSHGSNHWPYQHWSGAASSAVAQSILIRTNFFWDLGLHFQPARQARPSPH